MVAREYAIPLRDYPDYYVTPSGLIYSTLRRRLTRLRPGTKPGGYRFVGLRTADGELKYEMVHRLVAKTFIPNPSELPDINHRDGVKANNGVDNLEWISKSGNIQHAIASGLIATGVAIRCGLTDEQLREIKVANGRYRDIGAAFGVCAQTICNIKRGHFHKRAA